MSHAFALQTYFVYFHDGLRVTCLLPMALTFEGDILQDPNDPVHLVITLQAVPSYHLSFPKCHPSWRTEYSIHRRHPI